eukprot:5882586-Amphidinium_carterae.1
MYAGEAVPMKPSYSSDWSAPKSHAPTHSARKLKQAMPHKPKYRLTHIYSSNTASPNQKAKETSKRNELHK